MKGKLYPPETMFLRADCGEATVKNKGKFSEFKMSIHAATSCPIIQSKKSGNWFVLPWNDILELAIDAGIEKVMPTIPTPSVKIKKKVRG